MADLDLYHEAHIISEQTDKKYIFEPINYIDFMEDKEKNSIILLISTVKAIPKNNELECNEEMILPIRNQTNDFIDNQIQEQENKQNVYTLIFRSPLILDLFWIKYKKKNILPIDSSTNSNDYPRIN